MAKKNKFCRSSSCRVSYIHVSGICCKFWRNWAENHVSRKMFQGHSHSYVVNKHRFTFFVIVKMCFRGQSQNDESVFSPSSLWELHHQLYIFQAPKAHFLCWNKISPPVGLSLSENTLYLLNLWKQVSSSSHICGGKQKMGDTQVLSRYKTLTKMTH